MSGLQFDPAKAREGRAAMRRRCMAVALAETPDSILYVRIRRDLTGHAVRVSRVARRVHGTVAVGERTIYPVEGYMIAAPRPVTRRSLYIYLHEIGHVVLGHCDRGAHRRLRAWQRERQAERFAHERMRAHGIAVPRKETRRAKAYVARKREHGRRSAHRHQWEDFPPGHAHHGKLQRCGDPECHWMRPKRDA